MFDPLRNEEDIVSDVEKLNNICQEYKRYKAITTAFVRKFNIKEVIECGCRDFKNGMTFDERVNCKKCGGLGFIINVNEDKE